MTYRIDFYGENGKLIFTKYYPTYHSIYYVKIMAREHLKYSHAVRFEITPES